MHRTVLVLLSIVVLALAEGPKLRPIHSFTGTLANSSSVATDEFVAKYGSGDVIVEINFEKGENNITQLNVTYCLQRKISDQPGQDLSGCINAIVLHNTTFGTDPVEPPVKPPVTPPAEPPVEEPFEEPVIPPVEEPTDETDDTTDGTDDTTDGTDDTTDDTDDTTDDTDDIPDEGANIGRIQVYFVFDNKTFPVSSSLPLLENGQDYYHFLKFDNSNATDLKFSVNVQAKGCDKNQYIDSEGECKTLQEADEDPIKFENVKDLGVAFNVEPIENKILGGKQINVVFDNKEADLVAYFKFGAPPTKNIHDFAYNSTGQNITFPVNTTIAGVWYGLFVFGDNVNGTINHATSHCPVSANVTYYGVDCKTPISNITEDGKILIAEAHADYLVYFRAKAQGFNNTGFFNISLGSYNKSSTNVFELYLSEDELPYFSNTSKIAVADWGRCSLNKTACSIVSTIRLKPATGAKYYYIGVRFIGGKDDPTYFGIFKNSICAECSNGGKCIEFGEGRGSCQCKDEYEGLSCGVPRQAWKIQLIVLIVIGGLLFLTTLIGLIAWIISRKKKKEGYEKV